MEELLGDDGAKGTVGTQLGKIKEALVGAAGTDGIKKAVGDAVNTAGNQPGTAALNIKDKFTELTTAVKAATDAINEKLESGDLTQLDTSNLKALRSSISDIQSQLESSFTDLGLKFNDANNAVPLDKLKKITRSA